MTNTLDPRIREDDKQGMTNTLDPRIREDDKEILKRVQDDIYPGSRIGVRKCGSNHFY